MIRRSEVRADLGVRGTGCNVVKKFLQHKAIEEETLISDLINERFEEEMASDKLIALIEERKREPTISFEEALKECGLTYADLQD